MHPTPRAASAPSAARLPIVLGSLALLAAVAIGVTLRLADPLSSSVVPAEDPYTHMALVREHLRTGELHGLNSHESLYPPGLHAFLAAAWVYTGSDLYGITLLGPVVFGAIGILGVGLLLWRTAGPVAGFVGALAVAVAPEAIFRTTMMSPTAFDLAVLPFLFYALLRVLAGRLGWVVVALPLSVFLAFAHPWMLVILCAAAAVFVVLSLLFVAPAPRAEPLSLLGMAVCLSVLGIGAAIALRMPGFNSALHLPNPAILKPLGLGLAAAALLPTVVLAVLRMRGRTFAWPTRGPAHVLVRAAASLAIGAAVLVTYLAAQRQGLPEFVDLPRMIGWPILALAFAAVVLIPFIATPLANLSAALAAVTFPFVVFNPLHSEFLPHRTAVFFGLAAALLAGVAAGAVVRALSGPLHAWSSARATSGRRAPRPLVLAAAPILLVATLLGGSVYAGTPDSYPGGWYRLYNSCELDAFRQVAAQADAQPDALIVTGDWQAKLVLSAFTNDAQRVWYAGPVYSSEKARGDLVGDMAFKDRPILLVVDRYLHVETPDADTGFVASEPWHETGAWCAGMGLPQPRVLAYSTASGP